MVDITLQYYLVCEGLQLIGSFVAKNLFPPVQAHTIFVQGSKHFSSTSQCSSIIVETNGAKSNTVKSYDKKQVELDFRHEKASDRANYCPNNPKFCTGGKFHCMEDQTESYWTRRCFKTYVSI